MAYYTLTTSANDFYSTVNKFKLIVGLSALYRLQSNGCYRRPDRLPPGDHLPLRPGWYCSSGILERIPHFSSNRGSFISL